MDFSLGCGKPDARAEFEESFPVWAKAIVLYCKDTQVRSTALQQETENFSEDTGLGKRYMYICFGFCKSYCQSCNWSEKMSCFYIQYCIYIFYPSDDTVIMALRCLALLFFPGKTKKLGEGIPYVLREFRVSLPNIH